MMVMYHLSLYAFVLKTQKKHLLRLTGIHPRRSERQRVQQQLPAVLSREVLDPIFWSELVKQKL